MEGLIIIAVLILPGVLTSALRRTVLFWLPGVGLLILGFIVYGSISDTHGDTGGVVALGNGFAALGGIASIGYGLLCLGAGSFAYLRSITPSVHLPPPPVELPPVTVVKDLSET